LWRGDCEKPAGAKLLVASPTASFLDGVLTHDRAGYLYSDTGGIWEVDLTTTAIRLVYATPPGRDHCLSLPPPRSAPKTEGGTWIDKLAGLTDNGATLVLHRAPFSCAGPSDYEVRVTDYRDPAKARAHVARPIYGITAFGKTLFMLDGGGIWRSQDGGITWSQVTPVGLPSTGTRCQLGTLSDHQLLLRTSMGAAAAYPVPVSSGALYVSNDGARWSRFATPADVERPENQAPAGLDPSGVAWLDTSLRGVLVVGTDAAVDGHSQALEQRAWVTRDSGATWQAVTARPPKRPYTAQIGGDLFEATADGVVRIRNGLRAVVTPELPRPYFLDLFGGSG
jgi:hypothetical protein